MVSASSIPIPTKDDPLVRLAFLYDDLKMKGIRYFFATSEMQSAVRSVISRPSTTHGPAISTIGFSPPIDIEPMETIRIRRIQKYETRDNIQKIDPNFKGRISSIVSPTNECQIKKSRTGTLPARDGSE
jgi:hypothetical protein